MPTPVLLSRGIDPVLGIFTGCFAYYLHETNPRTAPPRTSNLSHSCSGNGPNGSVSGRKS
ncbi:hypothetical protein BDR07DRAFT_470086 [Suillus spraguei]|nr:hypothetical protein BDR07DRAFT_470086 [Suillus spraguei]